jgi:hypothetical protein
MPDTALQELENLSEALADCYDRTVWLEDLMVHSAQIASEADILALLLETAQKLACAGAAIWARGRWLQEVPSWLAALPAPAKRLQRREEALYAVAFPGGWLALWGRSKPFSAHDQRIVNALAQMIGVSLQRLEDQALRERLQLEEHERTLASQIWSTLVPNHLPAPAGYTLLSSFRPARDLGGDFQLALGSWRVLGDVSGKGLPAAMHSGLLSGLVPIALEQPDPPKALASAAAPLLERAGAFATLAMVSFGQDGRLSYVSFGHPPLLVRRLDGRVDAFGATAPPLGLFDPPPAAMRQLELKPGELLLVYTDGLIEADRGGELFGLERLRQLLEANPEPKEFLEALEVAMNGFEVRDDLGLHIYRYQGVGSCD